MPIAAATWNGSWILIRPEFICCLGAVASQNLLGTTVSIGKLRGKIHTFRGTKVVCTYHPAFLLRSPSFKKETWEDMKLLDARDGRRIVGQARSLTQSRQLCQA